MQASRPVDASVQRREFRSILWRGRESEVSARADSISRDDEEERLATTHTTSIQAAEPVLPFRWKDVAVRARLQMEPPVMTERPVASEVDLLLIIPSSA